MIDIGNPSADGQNKRLNALLNIACRLSSEINLNSLLDLIIKTVADLLDAERATVFLVDEEKKEIWSRVGIGIEKSEICFPINQGIAGHIARTGEVMIIDDPYNHPDFNKEIDYQTGFKTRNLLCAPMKNLEGKIIGVFQALNKRVNGFTEEDKELLLALASNAAIAIENAKLLEERNRQIMELKKAYDDLSAAQETIIRQEKLATIGQMASGIAHEIKSQLTVVSAVTSIRRLYPENEKVNLYTELILEARNRIVSILDEIRDYSKKKEYEMSECDLNSIIKTVVTLCKFDRDLEGIEFETILPEEQKSLVYVNADKIKQVLINLIRNAGHASPKHSTIRVEVEPEPEYKIIKVIDHGSGIPDEIAQRIWEPFFTTKEIGTGLGLDICKNIVESHNGQIWFDSKVGEGTTFYIKLPAKRQN